jgi:hypothetical protein
LEEAKNEILPARRSLASPRLPEHGLMVQDVLGGLTDRWPRTKRSLIPGRSRSALDDAPPPSASGLPGPLAHSLDELLGGDVAHVSVGGGQGDVTELGLQEIHGHAFLGQF